MMTELGGDGLISLQPNETALSPGAQAKQQKMAAPDAQAKAPVKAATAGAKTPPVKIGANGASLEKTPIGAAAVSSSHPSKDRQDFDWAAHDWNDLVPRLYAVAIWRLRQLRGPAIRLAEAGDFVNDALVKTFDGVRIWKPENCTLLEHLVRVIISDSSHAVNSSDSRLRVSDRDRPDGGAPWPPDMPDETPNQEQVEEWRSVQRGLLDHLNRRDPEIGRMAELILLNDVWKIEDLCRVLELTPSEVTNLRKRMKRAARAYYEENRS